MKRIGKLLLVCKKFTHRLSAEMRNSRHLYQKLARAA